MSEQLPLGQSKLEAAFWTFHRDHPEVYAELRSMALAAVERGRTRLGIAMLFEVVRWNRMMGPLGDRPFKLDNNHRAYYSRELMAREPTLAGLFATRKLGVDGHVTP